MPSFSQLFNLGLDYPIAFLLSFIPALLNIIILFYILLRFHHKKTLTVFAFFVLSLAVWQMSDSLIRLSRSAETALLWKQLLCIGPVFITPFGLHFTLRHTRRIRSADNVYLKLALYLPAIFFHSSQAAGLMSHKVYHSPFWNWVLTPAPDNLIANLMSWWTTLLALTMLALLLAHSLRPHTSRQKRVQSLLLFLGFLIPSVQGITTQFILPMYMGMVPVPISSSLMSLLSILMLVSLSGYRLLDYAPRHQWHHIVEKMLEGIVIVDERNKIVYANRRFCEMVQYPFEEMKGKCAHELLEDERYRQLLSGPNPDHNEIGIGHYETALKAKSGERIWVLGSSTPYLDPKGKVIGSIGIYTDIGKMKNAEQKLNEKIDELNSFFYKTSHDLMNPILSIKGLINFYKMKKHPEQETNRIFSYIEKSNERALHNAVSLSEIATIREKRLEPQEINLSEKVKQVADQVRTIHRGNAEIKVGIDHSLKIYCDRLVLRIIFQNLLDNAFRHYQHPQTPLQVEISAKETGNLIEIKIKDNGPGIPPEIHHQVFHMFFRGNNYSDGSGLGLYTAKCAVEKLGGKITLKSKTGAGSEFSVWVPKIFDS